MTKFSVYDLNHSYAPDLTLISKLNLTVYQPTDHTYHLEQIFF